MLLVKRLYGHVRQVTMEFLYGVLKAKIALPVAIRFLVMRLLTPFGFLIRNHAQHGSLGELLASYAGGISPTSRRHGLQPNPVSARHVAS